MDECLAGTVFACCGSVVAIVQYTFCSTRACGGDASCCDNCCRCNCCWPSGALPVEDYPNPNSVPDKPAEQSVDNDGRSPDANPEAVSPPPPAYKPTPQMSVTPASAPPPTA